MIKRRNKFFIVCRDDTRFREFKLRYGFHKMFSELTYICFDCNYVFSVADTTTVSLSPLEDKPAYQMATILCPRCQSEKTESIEDNFLKK